MVSTFATFMVAFVLRPGRGDLLGAPAVTAQGDARRW
jgi:hypothetical protein